MIRLSTLACRTNRCETKARLAIGCLAALLLSLGCSPESGSSSRSKTARNERPVSEFREILVGEWTVKTVFDTVQYQNALATFEDRDQQVLFAEQVAYLENESLHMTIREDGTYSVVDPASDSRDDGVWQIGLTQGDEFIVETTSSRLGEPEGSLFRIIDQNELEELPGEQEVTQVGLEFRYVLKRR